MHPQQNKNKKKKASLTTIKHVFKTLIWPRKKVLILGLILIIISRAAGMVLPVSTKYLIDNVIVQGDLELLKWLLIGILSALIIQAGTSFILTRLLSVEAHLLISQLRAKIQKHMIRLPVKYFDDNKSGALVSRIMTDVEGVKNLLGTGLVQLFGGMLTAVVSTFLLLYINMTMTFYVIIPLAIFGVVSLKTFSYIRPIFRKRRVINAEVTGRLTESLSGIRVIKGFNAEDREEKVFEKDVEKIFINVRTTLTTTSFVTSIATLLMGVATVTIMGLGGTRIINGTMTLGDFFMFTSILVFLIGPVLQMSNIGTQITEAFAGLDRMEEVLNMPQENDDNKRTIQLQKIIGDFQFKDVSFSYEENNAVLKNISFEAPSGSVTALVGSSGSGKTTLAGLAATFLNPDKGTITVDNNDITKITLDSYRSQLGVVLQDDFLFEGTIRQNILFSKPDASDEDLLKAVNSAHVNEFTDRFDKGLDTVIGERGIKLSGGQRQRVAIARAILVDPRVLILDEATSNLDTESESFIQESLSRLMKGRTTFVIAHRLSTIRRADRILVIEDGEIVEMGTHDELIKKEGRYHRLYTYQARI